jgi:hypothetical protein
MKLNQPADTNRKDSLQEKRTTGFPLTGAMQLALI